MNVKIDYFEALIKKININMFSIILGIPAVFVLLNLASLGSFVRYYGDDYCTSAELIRSGYWGAQIFWYNNWSGRYAYNLFVHASEVLGLNFFRILPTILSIFMVLSLVYFLRGITKNKISILSSVSISSALTALFLLDSPNIYQTYYWQTGSLTYFIPFVFLFFSLGLLARLCLYNKNNIYHNILIFILFFIAGGFAEAYITMQIYIILVLGVLISLVFKDWVNKIKLLVSGLMGSLISLALIFFAPGNKIRQKLIVNDISFLEIIKRTFIYSYDYLVEFFTNKNNIMLCLLIFIATLYLAIIFDLYFKIQVPQRVLILLSAPIVIFGLIMSMVAPGVYGLGTFPPDRTVFLVRLPIFMYVFLISCIISFSLATNLKRVNAESITILGTIMLLLVISISRVYYSYYNKVRSDMSSYSELWDQQHAQIKSQLLENRNKLVIPHLEPIGELPDAQKGSVGWVNTCMADFFGVSEVQTY